MYTHIIAFEPLCPVRKYLLYREGEIIIIALIKQQIYIHTCIHTLSYPLRLFFTHCLLKINLRAELQVQ